MCFPFITFSLISFLSLISLFPNNHAQHIHHPRNQLPHHPRNQLPHHLRVLTARPGHSYHGHGYYGNGMIHPHHNDHLLPDHLSQHPVINPLRSDHRYHGDHPYLGHHSDQVSMVNSVPDHQPLESNHQLQFHPDLHHFKTSHSNPIEDFINFGEISRHFSKINLHSEPESSGEIYHHDYHEAFPSARHELRLKPLSDDHDYNYRIRKTDHRTTDHHIDLISRHDPVDFHHRGGKLITDPLLISPISEESKLSLSLKDVKSENDPLMKLKQGPLTNELDSHAKKESRNIIPLPRGLTATKLQGAFYGSGIVPQLIKSPPKSILKVDFPSGEKVCLGNHLNFLDTLLQPTYNWDHKPGKLYTLMMVDPDAPIPESPIISPFVHHLVINIPGPLVPAGKSLINYFQPTVPPGSHFHRIVMLVFEQKSQIHHESVSAINFNVQLFIKLHKLGTPVAGNFFYSKFYVTRKVIC